MEFSNNGNKDHSRNPVGLETDEKRKLMPVAIVGMSCRLPGDVTSCEEFWSMMSLSRHGWGEIPEDRFNKDAYWHPNPGKKGCTNTRHGYFLNQDLGMFDAPFFNMTHQEAQSMDPQQRILLECAYEALENAGIPKERIAGQRVGVFVGGAASDFRLGNLRDLEHTPMFEATGNHQSILAGRISHAFDLRGPSYTVDTACSSGIYALHHAVQSIRAGESDSAIVTASHINLQPADWVSMSLSRLFSDEGMTYAFDSRAKSGFARGEGVCTLILKPLAKALADNDKIRSIIVSTGTNQDGRTVGITAPNGDAQEQLMREVYANADISPQDTGFVEAHGTGTKVGDPIEAAAIHNVFGEGRTAKAPLYMGSVKSNLGHLENASGLAAVIKGTMMLEKGFILPNINFQKPNENIPLAKWNIKVPVTQRPWPGNKRFLSVNNFGFGGSNAHCVLERPPILSRAGVNPMQLTFQKRLFVVSGEDETAAKKAMENLSVYLEQHPEVFQGALTRNLAYTLCERRSHLSWRFAMSAANSSDLNAALSNPDLVPVRAPKRDPKFAFVYTGQGAQWHAMGRELMDAYPVFAATMQAADGFLKDFGADYSLIEELSKDKESSRVGEAYLSQPACTAVQLALTDLVKYWGIEPSSVTGHSSGEIGAAYAAAAISLKDAMAIAYHRGQATIQLKAEQPSLRGSMLAVGAGPDEVRPMCEKLQHGVAVVACENSPSSVTASGDETAIDELAAEIESRQLFNRKLKVDVAYHSAHMQLVSDSYRRAIQDVTGHKVNKVSFYSSLRGTKVSTDTLDATYWTENLICPVRFSTSLQDLYNEETPDVIIEIGPHSALEGPIKQILRSIGQKASKTSYLSVLSRGQDAVTTALNLAGKVFQNGHQQLNFARINREEGTDMPDLPAGVRELQERPVFLHDLRPYPWSHQRYWYESLQSKQHRMKPFPRHDLLGTMADFSNELAPTWRNVLRTDDLPWLRDHKMQSLTTFPFAGFVSMAVEAAAQRAKMRGRVHERISLREVQVSKPLLMHDDAEYELSLSMSSYAEGTKSYSEDWDNFCISSWEESRGWTEHCRGLVTSRKGDDSNAVNSSHLSIAARKLQEAHRACTQSVSPARFYTELDDKGANYGPCFQRLQEISFSDQRSVAVLGVANTAATMPLEYETAYLVHPSLLDTVLQLCFSNLGAGYGEMNVLYMPSFIKELHIQPSKLPTAPGQKARVACYGGPDFQTTKPVEFAIDALTCSEQPEAIISMTGFQMSPLQAYDGANNAPRELCYKVQWALADELVEPDSPTSPVSAMYYAHEEGSESLPTPTSSLFSPWSVRSNPLSEYGDFSAQGTEIDSDSDRGHNEDQEADVIERYGMPIDFGKGSGKAVTIVSETLHSKTVMKYLTAATLQRTGRAPTFCSFENLKDLDGQHVILSELEKPILSDMTEKQFAQVQKILTQAQGVLWVTNGAYVDSTNPTKAMSLGLTRTVRSETAARIATLDLDPSSSLKPVGKAALILQTFDKVFGQDANGSADMEYTERNGTLYVPRIVNDEEMNVFVQRELHESAPYLQDFEEANRRLKIEVGTFGALDTIYFKDDDVEAPLGEFEIEIEVKATGMNFKDVMVAMGLLRQPYLGVECAGVVSSIGLKVTALAVGDRVCAVTHGAYSTFARCPDTSAAKIPQDMGYDIAASIPVAYCTAYYGMIELARLARGERILIHAAAGGVGQAAIQIAQMLDAEIFATVGSPEKKSFIMERYGIQEDHIFSSRDTSFAAGVKDATQGVGVDVVLNSLAGDMMRETWNCVAHFGRFIEIGKRDITSNTRLEMAKFSHNATFSSVDLAVLAVERPAHMAQMFKTIMSLFESKTLDAISPVKTFGISEVGPAFRLLQSGKSTGKLVIVPQAKEQVKASHRKSSRKLFEKDATYAIVGGTGGLGRSMTRWMVGQGAQNIVLLSRSGATDGPVGEMIREINMLSSARVVVKSCDVVDADSVSRVFRECDKELPPMRGIIHASMVLKDMLFEKMTLEDYNAVIQSKVAGAWNVHSELLSAPLDFFLVISSTAGIVGNRGQAAYAAANTFLDALAQYRLRHGLPGASIDLTAVSGVGYLAENAEREAEVLQNLGADPIYEDEVLALVGAAISGSMEGSCNNHCITGLKLGGGAAQLPAWSEDGKFKVLRDAVLAESGEASSSQAVSIGTQLARAESAEQAVEIVAGGVAEKLGTILVVPTADIDMTRPVTAYGLDSLNAIELRNWITKELGANLQVLELLTSGSLPSLAALIMKKREVAAVAVTAKAA